MATPNEGTPPRKPTPGEPGAKPPQSGVQPARPAGATPGKTPQQVTPGTPTSGGTTPPPKQATPPAQGAKQGVTPAKPTAPPSKPAASGAPGSKTDAAATPPSKPAQPAGGKPATPPSKPGKPATPSKKTAKAVGGRRKFGQVLIDLGYIDENQLWDLIEEGKTTSQPIGQVAVGRGLITDEQLLQALAEQHNLRIANLQEVKPTPEALALVPENMASIYKVLPLTFVDKVLTIAIGDPNNLASIDDLRNMLSVNEVIAQLAPQEAINALLEKVYAGKEESIIDIITSIETEGGKKKKKGIIGRQEETSIDIAASIVEDTEAPVRKLINMVFLLAIRDKASDVHFEPFEEEYKMRYRCDGVLYEMVPPPRHLANAIASRIKVMSNLDIAERRLPQDGRIELNVGGNPVDMRVSVLPTIFGESVVIRVLDRTVVSLDLNKLGFDPAMLAEFKELINKPNGIILVTGPTGAGKTTTLYSALNELNVITDKLITTEDPVEYDIDGIIQVPINTDIDVTFAAALRAILRQDPDKILVGEIRDLETAQIAVQAALTGHMVFSTLHTNDAPSTITRLRDMGLEPFLITATLEAVLAQRLVRKICSDCRTEFEPSPEMLMELQLTAADARGKKFYYGRGCDRCNNTGHKGRMGLYELVVINDDIRDLISQGVSTDELRKACRRLGMVTLRDSGLRAIFTGQTTIDEVVHETVLEEGE
jgi:type IV pilus assembly protein PilB